MYGVQCDYCEAFINREYLVVSGEYFKSPYSTRHFCGDRCIGSYFAKYADEPSLVAGLAERERIKALFAK